MQDKFASAWRAARPASLPRLAPRQPAAGDCAEDSFTVLAVPCNQFGGQEPKSHVQIVEFAQDKYGATFPITGKVDVNGEKEHPLFTWLKTEQSSMLGLWNDVKWNFACVRQAAAFRAACPCLHWSCPLAVPQKVPGRQRQASAPVRSHDTPSGHRLGHRRRAAEGQGGQGCGQKPGAVNACEFLAPRAVSRYAASGRTLDSRATCTATAWEPWAAPRAATHTRGVVSVASRSRVGCSTAAHAEMPPNASAQMTRERPLPEEKAWRMDSKPTLAHCARSAQGQQAHPPHAAPVLRCRRAFRAACVTAHSDVAR